MATEPRFRWFSERDLKQVLDIEKACFEFPWTEEDCQGILGWRGVIWLVLEADSEDNAEQSEIVGYVVYALEAGLIRLLNLAVPPKYRRSGIGVRMIDKMKSKLSRTNRTQIVLQIRETNFAGQKFFQSCGFVATGVVQSPHEETDEDDYMMVFDINESREREPVNRLAKTSINSKHGR